VVIPAAWVILRPGVVVTVHNPLTFACVTLLVALFSACGGLALGCSVNQQHIGLMFSMVLTPMIFFGCTYYPWSALNSFPILQKVVLVNPLVYASEGLRGTLVPQSPHLPLPAVLVALAAFDAMLLAAGLRQFWGKAVSLLPRSYVCWLPCAKLPRMRRFQVLLKFPIAPTNHCY
jgi:ABC-2 type transport system permease protein